ncbi:MAG: hypothetical protein PHX04_06650 [Bacilli bacterium]|nr:hypothetical protein [Bacilli bacterium]
MPNPAKSAFIGYNYQNLVATFFVFLLEEEVYQIEEVRAEIGIEGESFDDIFVLRNDHTNNLYIQVKNTINNLFTFNEEKVSLNKKELKLNKNGLNIIITKNDHNLNPTHRENGFAYYYNDLFNLVVVQLKIEDIIDYIYNQFSYSRINQLTLLTSRSFTNYQNCKISKEDLPDINFIPTNLLEQTFKIRDIKLQKERILFVFGKPGVGKSHLVDELNVPQNRLYRFWISNQDPLKSERLSFKIFLEQLSLKMFGSGRLRDENDIIDKINNLGEPFYIDGLDHVSNYAKGELDKYLKFIEKVSKTKKGRLIVLSRPLEKELNYPMFKLDDWSFDETREYLKYREVDDYSIATKIYKISKGYPIITSYLASEYLNNGNLDYEKAIDNIDEYYKTILKNVVFKNKLSIFIFSSTFHTKDELSKILKKSYKEMLEFIQTFPFLFEIQNNRVSLFHDSFNNFISNQIELDMELEEGLHSFIKESLKTQSVRFMSRILSYNLGSDFLSEILHMYSDFEVFINLKNNIIDFESIKNFYHSLRKIYSKDDIKLLSPEKAYEFSMILILLMRDNFEQSYGLMYQIYIYFKNNNMNWYEHIFSSESIYYAFNYFSGNGINGLIKLETNKGYGKDNIEDSIKGQIENEIYFFKNFETDKYQYFKNKVKNSQPFYARNYLESLLVSSYIFDHNEDGLKEIIELYLNKEYQISRYKLNKYLKSIGWQNTSTAYGSLYEAVNIIKQLGISSIENDYNKLTLKEIIQKYALDGSYRMNDIVTGYIRLANHKSNKIDINSLSYYYLMYYQRKDSSVLGLSEIFYELITRNLIGLEFAFDTIDEFQQMSEKGIRHLSDELVNLLGIAYVEELEKLSILNSFSNYNISFTNLSVDIINSVSTSFAENSIIAILNHEFDVKHRSNFNNNIIRSSDYSNVLESNYRNYFEEQIKVFGFELEYQSEAQSKNNNLTDEEIEEYRKKDPEESLNNGYVTFEDKEYYKEIGMNHLTFARYGSGWGDKLPYPNFLDLYDISTLREDVEKIVQFIISKSFYGIKYNDERIESQGDRGLLSGLPKFYEYINLEFDWNKIKDLVIKMINISLTKL